MDHKKGNALIIALALIPILIFVGVITFFTISQLSGIKSAQEARLHPPTTPQKTTITSVKDLPLQDIPTNWKTYANQKQGYSLRYPDNYNLKENSGSAEFSNQPFDQKNSQSTAEIIDTAETKSTLEFDVSLPYDVNDLEKDVFKRSNPPRPSQRITINGMKAFVVEGTGTSIGGESFYRQLYYYIRAKNGNVYAISKQVAVKDPSSEDIFNKMLSSFTLL